MNASPQTIWQVPVYLPYLQPALTDSIVAEAERKIGFRLPESYLALLREQNGGYVRYSLPETPHSQIYGIGPHFPSLTDFTWNDSQEHVSFQLEGLVPFDGDGHWHLCLDYRKNPSSPSVAYVDIECNRESNVAASFEEFLTLLKVELSENDFVMPGIADLALTLGKIESRAGTTFSPPDTFAHGYPTYRARGAGEKPEWIWISPNVVRRGFVRTNDERFEELRDLMTELIPRYPELPEASYLLTVTAGLRSSVLSVCSQIPIDIRPLSEYVIS